MSGFLKAEELADLDQICRADSFSGVAAQVWPLIKRRQRLSWSVSITEEQFARLGQSGDHKGRGVFRVYRDGDKVSHEALGFVPDDDGEHPEGDISFIFGGAIGKMPEVITEIMSLAMGEDDPLLCIADIQAEKRIQVTESMQSNTLAADLQGNAGERTEYHCTITMAFSAALTRAIQEKLKNG